MSAVGPINTAPAEATRQRESSAVKTMAEDLSKKVDGETDISLEAFMLNFCRPPRQVNNLDTKEISEADQTIHVGLPWQPWVYATLRHPTIVGLGPLEMEVTSEGLRWDLEICRSEMARYLIVSPTIYKMFK